MILSEMSNAYLGSSQVISMYLNGQTVWPLTNPPPPPPPVPNSFWYNIGSTGCATLTINSNTSIPSGLYFGDDGTYSGISVGNIAYRHCFAGNGSGPIFGNVTVSLPMNNSIQNQSLNSLVGRSLSNWSVDGQVYGGPYGPGFGYTWYGYIMPDANGFFGGNQVLETNGNGHWNIGVLARAPGTYNMNTIVRGTDGGGQVYAYNLYYNLRE